MDQLEYDGADRSAQTPTRARKRRADREQCTARARSRGRRCEAPAIEGGTVCLKHGGAAPQVALAARRRVLAERVLFANLDWQDARDPARAPGQLMNRREADALGIIAVTTRQLAEHDQDVALIVALRAAVHQQRAGALDPDVRDDLLEIARARLSDRP